MQKAPFTAWFVFVAALLALGAFAARKGISVK